MLFYTGAVVYGSVVILMCIHVCEYVFIFSTKMSHFWGLVMTVSFLCS